MHTVLLAVELKKILNFNCISNMAMKLRFLYFQYKTNLMQNPTVCQTLLGPGHRIIGNYTIT